MTFYQELQLNQAGSKNLLKKSETLKEKLYHMWVYLVKIAATMAFCFFFVSIFSILFGNENSIVGVVVLLCLMVFRNADLGIHTGQSTMLLALFFVVFIFNKYYFCHYSAINFPKSSPEHYTVTPSSSGRSGWSAGRSPFEASLSAGSFSAASASSGPRWRVC